MADDITPATPPTPYPERDPSDASVTKGAKRKYTYKGKAHSNPKVYLTVDDVRIRPWAMTDEQIDKLLERKPALKRLFSTAT